MRTTARLLTVEPESAADPAVETAASKASRSSRDDSPPDLSVADLARRWKVSPDKILSFIRCGELTAVNVASNLSGRPQWRIRPEAIREFDQRRSSAPPPKPQKRKRHPGIIDFYPN